MMLGTQPPTMNVNDLQNINFLTDVLKGYSTSIINFSFPTEFSFYPEGAKVALNFTEDGNKTVKIAQVARIRIEFGLAEIATIAAVDLVPTTPTNKAQTIISVTFSVGVPNITLACFKITGGATVADFVAVASKANKYLLTFQNPKTKTNSSSLQTVSVIPGCAETVEGVKLGNSSFEYVYDNHPPDMSSALADSTVRFLTTVNSGYYRIEQDIVSSPVNIKFTWDEDVRSTALLATVDPFVVTNGQVTNLKIDKAVNGDSSLFHRYFDVDVKLYANGEFSFKIPPGTTHTTATLKLLLYVTTTTRTRVVPR